MATVNVYAGPSSAKKEKEREPITPEQLQARAGVVALAAPPFAKKAGDATKTKTPLYAKILDLLDKPRQLLSEAIFDGNENAVREFFFNTFEGDSIADKIFRNVGTFVGEVVTDPLSYVSFGASGVAKSAVKEGVVRHVLDKAARETAEGLALKGVKTLDELAEATGKRVVTLVEENPLIKEAAERVAPAGTSQRVSKMVKALTPDEYLTLPKQFKTGIHLQLPFGKPDRKITLVSGRATSKVSAPLSTVLKPKVLDPFADAVTFNRRALKDGWKGYLYKSAWDASQIHAKAAQDVANHTLTKAHRAFGTDEEGIDLLRAAIQDPEGTVGRLTADQVTVLQDLQKFKDDIFEEMSLYSPTIRKSTNYFPRVVSDDGRTAMYGADVDGQVFARLRQKFGAEFQERRIKAKTVEEANRWVEKHTGVKDFFDTNPYTALEKWIKRTSKDLAHLQFVHNMDDAGVFMKDIKQHVSEHGAVYASDLKRAGFGAPDGSVKAYPQARTLALHIKQGQPVSAADMARWNKLPEDVRDVITADAHATFELEAGLQRFANARAAEYKAASSAVDLVRKHDEASDKLLDAEERLAARVSAVAAAKAAGLEAAERARALRAGAEDFPEGVEAATLRATVEELRSDLATFRAQKAARQVIDTPQQRKWLREEEKKFNEAIRQAIVRRDKAEAAAKLARTKAVAAAEKAEAQAKAALAQARLRVQPATKAVTTARAEVERLAQKHSDQVARVANHRQRAEYYQSGFDHVGQPWSGHKTRDPGAEAIDPLLQPSDLVEVRGTNLGILEGIFVPPAIAAELMENFRNVTPTFLMQKYDNFLRMFKRWVTVPWPGFHVRNAVGGWTSNWMGGVRFRHDLDVGRIVDKLDGSGKGINGQDLMPDLETERLYGHSRQLLEQDIRGLGNQSMLTEFDTVNPGLKGKGLRSIPGRYSQVASNVASATELQLRGAAYLRGLELSGGDRAFARAFSLQRHGNYSELTAVEEQLRRLLPFYKWLRTNVPFQFEQLLEQPGRVAKLNRSVEIFADEEETDNLKARGLFPDYLAARGAFVLGEGRATPLVFSPDLPFTDIQVGSFLFGDLSGTTTEIVSSLTPPVKLFVELATEKNLFVGRDMKDTVAARGVLGGIARGLEKVPGLRGLTARTLGGELRINSKLAALLNSLPTSRLQSAANDFLKGSDQTKGIEQLGPLRGLTSSLLGLRLDELDQEQQEIALYFREQALKEVEAEARQFGYTEDIQQLRESLGLTARGTPRQAA